MNTIPRWTGFPATDVPNLRTVFSLMRLRRSVVERKNLGITRVTIPGLFLSDSHGVEHPMCHTTH